MDVRATPHTNEPNGSVHLRLGVIIPGGNSIRMSTTDIKLIASPGDEQSVGVNEILRSDGSGILQHLNGNEVFSGGTTKLRKGVSHAEYVLIFTARLNNDESFKLVFPEMYLNDKAFKLPMISFKKKKEVYLLVLNC